MSTTRIYLVREALVKPRLVEATTSSQAIRHCARQLYTAKPATPKEIAELMVIGLRVEQAADDSLIPTQPTASTDAQHTKETTK